MKKNTFIYCILLLLIVVTAFQYSAWGIAGGENIALSDFVMVIAAILVLLSSSFDKLFKYYRDVSLFRTNLLVVLMCVLIFTILSMLGFYVIFMPIRDLILSLLFVLIGLNIITTKKQFDTLISLYVFLYMIAALSIVFTFSSGFVINEFNLPIPKNQLSPAFGVGLILSQYYAFKKSGIRRYLYIFATVLLLASLLVIRGRAVIFSFLIINVVFIFFYIKNRRIFLYYISILLLLMPYLWIKFYDALFLHYDVTDVNSISTGRAVRNISALDYLLKNPFFGTLGDGYGYVHNYVLHTLVLYGLFWGIIILYVYFKYVSTVIMAIKVNTFDEVDVGPLIIAMLILVSLFEYTYPYAPGSAVYFAFIMIGQYLKKKKYITCYS